ncbi:TNT domain-containing protein [Actinosynnema pretiosum subsp. pretiosum]|uniref:TNT domain-containing protein n=1 Tax=Actinosynnema pretiosum subsp. pretiosum TaxID=103721 RepID=A0AA45L378_9PSEU|nr:hypothetical protein APASM_6333 [Actinosynnema pretiosum subsp. pretiosum]QUF02527.1 TNT domain-containing protein [Actinosynnema pretiosum subsp. pretiosum]
MGIELPAELAEVAARAGVSWPQADEDKLRASAAAWRAAGRGLDGLAGESDDSAGRVLGGMAGSTATAARTRWDRFIAADGDLVGTARDCHAAADRLDHAAGQIGKAKVELVRELVNLAKNADAAQASASAGQPSALLGLDTAVRGTAANAANLTAALTDSVRLDSGADVATTQPPVNPNPGVRGGLLDVVGDLVEGVVTPVVETTTRTVEAVAQPVVGLVEPVVDAVVRPVVDTAAQAVGQVTGQVAGHVTGQVTEPVAAAAQRVDQVVGSAPAHVADVAHHAGQHAAPVATGAAHDHAPRHEGTTSQSAAALLDRPAQVGGTPSGSIANALSGMGNTAQHAATSQAGAPAAFQPAPGAPTAPGAHGLTGGAAGGGAAGGGAGRGADHRPTDLRAPLDQRGPLDGRSDVRAGGDGRAPDARAGDAKGTTDAKGAELEDGARGAGTGWNDRPMLGDAVLADLRDVESELAEQDRADRRSPGAGQPLLGGTTPVDRTHERATAWAGDPLAQTTEHVVDLGHVAAPTAAHVVDRAVADLGQSSEQAVDLGHSAAPAAAHLADPAAADLGQVTAHATPAAAAHLAAGAAADLGQVAAHAAPEAPAHLADRAAADLGQVASPVAPDLGHVVAGVAPDGAAPVSDRDAEWPAVPLTEPVPLVHEAIPAAGLVAGATGLVPGAAHAAERAGAWTAPVAAEVEEAADQGGLAAGVRQAGAEAAQQPLGHTVASAAADLTAGSGVPLEVDGADHAPLPGSRLSDDARDAADNAVGAGPDAVAQGVAADGGQTTTNQFAGAPMGGGMMPPPAAGGAPTAQATHSTAHAVPQSTAFGARPQTDGVQHAGHIDAADVEPDLDDRDSGVTHRSSGLSGGVTPGEGQQVERDRDQAPAAQAPEPAQQSQQAQNDQAGIGAGLGFMPMMAIPPQAMGGGGGGAPASQRAGGAPAPTGVPAGQDHDPDLRAEPRPPAKPGARPGHLDLTPDPNAPLDAPARTPLVKAPTAAEMPTAPAVPDVPAVPAAPTPPAPSAAPTAAIPVVAAQAAAEQNAAWQNAEVQNTAVQNTAGQATAGRVTTTQTAAQATDQPATEPDADPASDSDQSTSDLSAFVLALFPGGSLPEPSRRPTRQLPPPAESDDDYADGLRFPPGDHPQSHLVAAAPPATTPPSGKPNTPEPPAAVMAGYDPLAGMHERDWEHRFLARAQPPEYAWPPAELFPEGGYESGQPVKLAPGTVLDRFGTPEGRVLSRSGTPYPARALPPAAASSGYRRYRVLRELPAHYTLSAEWFGQRGGGARYRATHPVADLVALGYLEELP